MNTTVKKTAAIMVAILITVCLAYITSRATEDTSPPVFTAFSFTPISINTSSGDASTVVSATITDDLSGFSQGGGTFRSTGSGQQIPFMLMSSNRVSGSKTNGTYHTTVTLPRYSKTGVWKLITFWVTDRTQNSMNYQFQSSYGTYSSPYRYIHGQYSSLHLN